MTQQQNTALFKQDIVCDNFKHVAPHFTQTSIIHAEVARRLVDRLHDIKRDFPTVLDLGCGTGHVSKLLLETGYNKNQITSADICPQMLQQATGKQVLLDAEKPLPFPNEHFNLILSNLMLPWINDVPGCLLHAGRALKKDGLLLATTLGLESFKEFRYAFQAAGSKGAHIPPLTDLQAIASLMQRLKFALPVLDRDTITITYPDFASLYADLKQSGVKNMHPARSKGLMGKKRWQKMEEIYAQEFMLENGQIPLTLEILYLSGWREDSSQPKALKPGSKAVPLSDVLSDL